MSTFVRNIENPTRCALHTLVEKNERGGTVARKRIYLGRFREMRHQEYPRVLHHPADLGNRCLYAQTPMQTCLLRSFFDLFFCRCRNSRKIKSWKLQVSTQALKHHS